MATPAHFSGDGQISVSLTKKERKKKKSAFLVAKQSGKSKSFSSLPHLVRLNLWSTLGITFIFVVTTKFWICLKYIGKILNRLWILSLRSIYNIWAESMRISLEKTEMHFKNLYISLVFISQNWIYHTWVLKNRALCFQIQKWSFLIVASVLPECCKNKEF